MKKLRLPLVGMSLLALALVAWVIWGWPSKAERLTERINDAFDELLTITLTNATPEQLAVAEGAAFPYAWVTKYDLIRRGDVITSARAAQVRIFRVSTNMAKTKETLLLMLQTDEDNAIIEGDRRLSMHPERRRFDIGSLAASCSPAMLPLRSNTWATVLFGDTLQDALVALDDDGKAINLESYQRDSCTQDSTDTYVTIVMWAM